jgi:hypothetical protein
MSSASEPQSTSDGGLPAPHRPAKRKESHAELLYMGFSVVVIVLTTIGMWYAAMPVP